MEVPLSHLFFNCNSKKLFCACRQKFSKKYGIIQCDPLVLVGLEKCVS